MFRRDQQHRIDQEILNLHEDVVELQLMHNQLDSSLTTTMDIMVDHKTYLRVDWMPSMLSRKATTWKIT